jgi:hypothetical protein
LLGAHIHWGPDRQSGQSQPISYQTPGDAEVCHQHVSIAGDEQVFWLDVAMDDPVAVSIVERMSGFHRDADGFLYRQLMFSTQPLAQRFTLDIGHGIPQVSCGLARVVHREDVRMLQLRRELNFSLKALGAHRSAQLQVQDLERSCGGEVQVMGKKNTTAIPPWPSSLDPVTVGKAGFQLQAKAIVQIGVGAGGKKPLVV